MAASAPDIQGLLTTARLPSMPQILLKLLTVCQSDTADMADIAKLVANDAALTARILGVANSAAYQRDGRKAGLLHSLHVLGSEMVKTLLISESVYQAFAGFANTAHRDLSHFWRDALSTAVIARDVAKAMGHPQVEEAYLAGLLHDAGRLALLTVVPAQYAPLFLERDDAELCTAEMRAFQFTHAHVGAWLVERWNLDTFMADSVRYHHEDRARVHSAPPMVRIVHLAHGLAAMPPGLPLPVDAGALCGLALPVMEGIRQRTAAQVEKSAAFIGIVLTNTPAVPVAPPVQGPAVPDAGAQRLSQEVRDMALSSEWARSLARVNSDAQRLTMVRQSAQVYFDWADSLVFLQSGNGRELLCVSAAQQRQRLLEFAVPLAQRGAIATAVLQRRVEFVESGSPQCGLAEDQLLRATQADVLVCLPLNSGTRCLGVVVGAVSAAALADLRQRVRFLQSFAEAAAIAMDAQAREASDIDQHIAHVRAEFIQRSRSMAHEVNNPLAILKSYLGVLDDKVGRAEPVTHELMVLSEELDRIGNILAEFVGTAAPRPAATIDLNHVVDDVVALFRESRFLPPLVQMEAQLAPQPCWVAAVPDVLKQILVNLIKNAVEALPTGGQITVTSQNAVSRDGSWYCAFRVRDNGPGMPASTRAQLFKPLASAKPGDNRGIGMSIVQGLVHKLGGHIACTSAASGTCFEVLVPAAPERSLSGTP